MQKDMRLEKQSKNSTVYNQKIHISFNNCLYDLDFDIQKFNSNSYFADQSNFPTSSKTNSTPS